MCVHMWRARADARYVHEASDDLYVPEVHYQTQNEYVDPRCH